MSLLDAQHLGDPGQVCIVILPSSMYVIFFLTAGSPGVVDDGLDAQAQVVCLAKLHPWLGLEECVTTPL